MEMYAFIHYSLNTYTDQEWGFGNEDPQLFNPSNLDCRQWVRVCKQSGMRGIIFTAKHHCGFCMWPSAYIKRTSVYLAPELTADIPDAGEKRSSNLHFFFSSPKQMIIDWDTEQTFTTFRYLPPQASKEGTVTHYTLWVSTDWANWTKVAQGEFSNVVNNPIWQTVTFPPVRAKIFRFDAGRLAEGERMAFDDFDICANNQ